MAHTNEDELQEVRQLVWDILRDEVPQKIEGWRIWYEFDVAPNEELMCVQITLSYSCDMYGAASSNHVRFVIAPDSPLIVTQTREYICNMVKSAIHYIIDHRRSVLETQRLVYPPSEN
jgi:hypothetical protein